MLSLSQLPLKSHFMSTDQIDEHLKMTLQEDLTSMAPGIIIQVQIKRQRVKSNMVDVQQGPPQDGQNRRPPQSSS